MDSSIRSESIFADRDVETGRATSDFLVGGEKGTRLGREETDSIRGRATGEIGNLARSRGSSLKGRIDATLEGSPTLALQRIERADKTRMMARGCRQC